LPRVAERNDGYESYPENVHGQLESAFYKAISRSNSQILLL